MQSRAKSGSYGITGVPTMIVNGKYRIDGQSAGGTNEMLQVVDYLVAKSWRPKTVSVLSALPEAGGRRIHLAPKTWQQSLINP